MAEARVFDVHNCILGEGPLWHPDRQELFWFDIIGKQLRSKARVWDFDEYVSAAGWIDHDTLIMASASALWRFDISTGWREKLVDMEADNALTRSNDGRADPWGGFWIGTMGINAEDGAGAIYRYYRGELVTLYKNISISNAICFAPDKSAAYWSDTLTRHIMRVALDPDHGWPEGPADVLIDVTAENLAPDGAVVDRDGNIWNAQWGSNRVAVYAPDGRFLKAVDVPAKQASCPAFGGADFDQLFVTSAAEGLTGAVEGRTYVVDSVGRGLPEHQVRL
ncbi:MAG: SMP-30/gluconolactonase/LRE family protein [Pseudomonadota bacterium]